MFLLLIATAAVTAMAQTPAPTPAETEENEPKNYIELRGGGKTYYEYEEYTRELPKGFSFTALHVREGSDHEFSVGFGKALELNKMVTLTPVVYATFGSHGQRGATIGAYVEAEQNKLKARAFVGRFINIKGQTESYTGMDVGDVTYAVSKKWDIGVSTTFFCQGGCTIQSGPIVRRNDKLGAWEFSYRFGKEENQFRLTRTFSFGK